MFPTAFGCICFLIAAYHYKRYLAGSLHQSAFNRYSQICIEDYPYRITASFYAAVEHRIVCKYGTYSYGYTLVIITELMNMSSCFFSAYPLRLAAVRSYPSVCCHCIFESHIGLFMSYIVKKYRIQCIALVSHEVLNYFDAGFLKYLRALSGNKRIGITGAYIYLSYT